MNQANFVQGRKILENILLAHELVKCTQKLSSTTNTRIYSFVLSCVKEKRWVVFKREEDPTSIPVEWICWLNGQRKRAPTPEELMDLEARRERVRQNVALLKKEEEERKAREGSARKVINTDKVGGPDLKSFIRQFGDPSEGDENQEESVSMEGVRNSKEKEAKKAKQDPESTEPTGSGQTFRPGTWQPPT
ncbi:unnamed protein product [Prunus armeniaca]|uniref:NADH dehydrogenase [ubiquinone] 1 alpha subcomplex subunit 12 n=1 Tax=Prunus armeniaca TaxID=36596 RepID=A0A6J5UMT9_PRUAR|nr:unnamed protein product [Prunus armeniaca]